MDATFWAQGDDMTDTDTAETETTDTETAGNTEDITSLSDVFDDSEPQESETQGAEETGDKPTEETEETSETSEQEETPSSEAGLKAALAAERKKRQQLEEAQKEKQPIPDPIEDPEGYANYLESRNAQDSTQLRISLSRSLIMDQKEDYTEKEKVFMGLVADEEGNIVDETLHRKFLQSDNPALFAYETAKEHQEIQELKSPEYKEKLRAELMEELKKELGGDKKRSVEVPDLTSVAASGKNTEEAENLPEQPGELFSDKDQL